MNPVVATLVAQTHRVSLAARGVVFGLAIASLLALAGCGEGEDDAKAPTAAPPTTAQPGSAQRPARAAKPALPDDLDLALVLSLSVFPEAEPGDVGPPVPLPSELEFIQRKGGGVGQGGLERSR